MTRSRNVDSKLRTIMGYIAIMRLESISFKVSRNDGDEVARRKDARNPDTLQGPSEEEKDKNISDFGR